MNQNLTKDGTNYGSTIKSAWVNVRMSKGWWIGVFCGAFSVIYTWSLYKQYNAFLNTLPTLLGLIILLGFFLFCSLSSSLYLFGINILFKKFLEILIISLGIENVSRSGLSRNQVKMFLIKIGVGMFVFDAFYYCFGEKYNSLLDSLPDWLKVLLSLAFVLGIIGVFTHSYLCNKKRMQNQCSDKENREVTP